MQKDVAFIAAQTAYIEQSITMLRAGVQVVSYVGGMVQQGQLAAVAFQERRLKVMQWIQTATVAEIEARLATAREALGPEGQRLLGGMVTGLPEAVVEQVSTVEMLQYALIEGEV